MYGAILGSQKRVWCPKWTPASSISRIVMVMGFQRLVLESGSNRSGRPLVRSPCSEIRTGPQAARRDTLNEPVRELLFRTGRKDALPGDKPIDYSTCLLYTSPSPRD